MEIKEHFSGTPAEFAAVVKQYSKLNRAGYFRLPQRPIQTTNTNSLISGALPVFMEDIPIHPDERIVTVYFGKDFLTPVGDGEITAVSKPDGESRVIAHIPDDWNKEDLEIFRANWDDLWQQIREWGWTDGRHEPAETYEERVARLARVYVRQQKTIRHWDNIIKYLNQGFRRDQIAEKLDLHEDTIDYHIENLEKQGYKKEKPP